MYCIVECKERGQYVFDTILQKWIINENRKEFKWPGSSNHHVALKQKKDYAKSWDVCKYERILARDLGKKKLNLKIKLFKKTNSKFYFKATLDEVNKIKVNLNNRTETETDSETLVNKEKSSNYLKTDFNAKFMKLKKNVDGPVGMKLDSNPNIIPRKKPSESKPLKPLENVVPLKNIENAHSENIRGRTLKDLTQSASTVSAKQHPSKNYQNSEEIKKCREKSKICQNSILSASDRPSTSKTNDEKNIEHENHTDHLAGVMHQQDKSPNKFLDSQLPSTSFNKTILDCFFDSDNDTDTGSDDQNEELNSELNEIVSDISSTQHPEITSSPNKTGPLESNAKNNGIFSEIISVSIFKY